MLTIAAVVAAFVFAENDIAPKFGECVRQIAGAQSAENPHQHGLILFAFVRAQAICTLSLIDRHNGFFAFLGTAAIAGFTFILWRATDGMLLVTKEQRRDMERSVKAAEDAADAAKLTADTMAESNRITHEHHVADERPWISIKVHSDGKLLITPDGRWILFPTVTLKNHGASPALSVRYEIALIKDMSDIRDVQSEMRTYLDGHRADDGPHRGLSIFPGQRFEECDQIQKWNFGTPNAHGIKARDRAPPDGPFIVGCATYEFASGHKGATTIAYWVAKNAPSNTIIFGVGGGIEITDRVIPADLLIFHPLKVGNTAE